MSRKVDKRVRQPHQPQSLRPSPEKTCRQMIINAQIIAQQSWVTQNSSYTFDSYNRSCIILLSRLQCTKVNEVRRIKDLKYLCYLM